MHSRSFFISSFQLSWPSGSWIFLLFDFLLSWVSLPFHIPFFFIQKMTYACQTLLLQWIVLMKLTVAPASLSTTTKITHILDNFFDVLGLLARQKHFWPAFFYVFQTLKNRLSEKLKFWRGKQWRVIIFWRVTVWSVKKIYDVVNSTTSKKFFF